MKHEPIERGNSAMAPQPSYPMCLEKGHIIIEVGPYKALIDTGSPVSFARTCIQFYWSHKANAYKWQAPRMPHELPSMIDKINELAGLDIDMLIGNDILRKCDFALDFDMGELRLCPGRKAGTTEMPVPGLIPMDWEKGIPRIAGTLDHEPITWIIDTGAYQTFRKPRLWHREAPIGTHEDFLPGMGKFKTQLRLAHIALGDQGACPQGYTEPYGQGYGAIADLPWRLLPFLWWTKASGIIGTDIMCRYRRIGFTTTGLLLGPKLEQAAPETGAATT